MRELQTGCAILMIVAGFAIAATEESNLDKLLGSTPATSNTSRVVTTSPDTLALLDALTQEETHAPTVDPHKTISQPAPVPAPGWLMDDSQEIDPGCDTASNSTISQFPQALQVAICNNPEVRTLAFNLRQYLYAWRKSESAWMPDINLVLSGSSESDRYQTQQAGTLRQTDRNVDTGVELNWLLFDFGKREAFIGQQKSSWLSTRYQSLSGFQDFIIRFAQTYYQVIAKRTILAAAKENEEIARKTWDITQNKYRSGVGVLGDALQAENVLLSATQYRIEREGDYEQAVGQLANALNLPVTSSLHPQDVLSIPAEGQMMALQPLLDEATKHHPTILAAQQNIEAAQQQMNQAQRDFLPSVSLQAGLNRNTSSLDQQRYDPIDKTDNLFVGLNVKVPIFSGFRRYNQLNEAQAQLGASQQDYQSTLRQVELNTWNAWQALNTANRNVRLISQQLNTAHRAYDIAKGRYLTGVGTIIELLNTQQQLSNAEINEATVRMEWYLQRLALLASVGKLTLY